MPNKPLVSLLALVSLSVTFTACKNDPAPNLPTYKPYEVREIKTPEITTTDIDLTRINDILNDIDDITKLSDQIARSSERLLQITLLGEDHIILTQIRERKKELDEELGNFTGSDKKTKIYQDSYKLHKDTWSQGTDEEHDSYAKEMSTKSPNYYTTYKQAFIFAQKNIASFSNDEKHSFALERAESISDDQMILDLLEKPIGSKPRTTLTLLATFESAYLFATNIRKLNISKSIEFATIISNIEINDDIYLAVYHDAYSYSDIKRELHTDALKAEFSEDMAEAGVNSFITYKDAYTFAKDTRQFDNDKDASDFANSMMDKSADFLTAYKESYIFARDNRDIDQDQKLHELALEQASEVLKKPIEQ